MLKPRSLASAGKLAISLLTVVCALVLFIPAQSARAGGDTAGTKELQLIKPLSGATVREKVPISIARASLPSGGYAAILIDDVFIQATPFPDNDSDEIFVWDTKAPYTSPDDPDKKLYVQDGQHKITVVIYNRDSSEYGAAISNVQVSNGISNMKDGVTLRYKWGNAASSNIFNRKSELIQVNTASGIPSTSIEKSSIKFLRTVEDFEKKSGSATIGDRVSDDNSTITTRGEKIYLQSLYKFGDRLRDITSTGKLIRPIEPSSNLAHFGFAIPVLPARRVQIGDSWETPIEFTLQWGSEKPTTVTGTARLDSFEWQDNYPCAKIVESYDGPATLYINPPTSQSGGGMQGMPMQGGMGMQPMQGGMGMPMQGGMGMQPMQRGGGSMPGINYRNGEANGANGQMIPPISGANIHLTRIVWVAYESGLLVHVTTDVTVNGTVTAVQASAIGAGQNQQMQMQNRNQDEGETNPFTPGGYTPPTPGMSLGNGQTSAPITYQISEEIVRSR